MNIEAVLVERDGPYVEDDCDKCVLRNTSKCSISPCIGGYYIEVVKDISDPEYQEYLRLKDKYEPRKLRYLWNSPR